MLRVVTLGVLVCAIVFVASLIFLIGFAAAIIIGSIAGLAASHRSGRLDPAEALRRL